MLCMDARWSGKCFPVASYQQPTSRTLLRANTPALARPPCPFSPLICSTCSLGSACKFSRRLADRTPPQHRFRLGEYRASYTGDQMRR